MLSGIGESLENALSSVFREISNSIFAIFIRWLYELVFNALADFFSLMSGMGTKLFELAWIKSALEFFRLFGWGLFVVGLVVAIFEFATEYQSYGRANIKNTLFNILKGFFSVSLFTVLPVELYKFTITLQNVFAKDLTGSFANGQTGIEEIALGILNIYAPLSVAYVGLFNLVLIIALGYCVIKVFFSNIKRGGILLTQIAVGSLYMFSIPRGYGDGFTQWTKQVIALCLTTFMQTTLLFLGLITWKSDFLIGLGIMLAANEVPRIAQSFGLDTSVKMNMMSVVHTTSTAVNMAKAVAKK